MLLGPILSALISELTRLTFAEGTWIQQQSKPYFTNGGWPLWISLSQVRFCVFVMDGHLQLSIIEYFPYAKNRCPPIEATYCTSQFFLNQIHLILTVSDGRL